MTTKLLGDIVQATFTTHIYTTNNDYCNYMNELKFKKLVRDEISNLGADEVSILMDKELGSALICVRANKRAQHKIIERIKQGFFPAKLY